MKLVTVYIKAKGPCKKIGVLDYMFTKYRDESYAKFNRRIVNELKDSKILSWQTEEREIE